MDKLRTPIGSVPEDRVLPRDKDHGDCAYYHPPNAAIEFHCCRFDLMQLSDKRSERVRQLSSPQSLIPGPKTIWRSVGGDVAEVFEYKANFSTSTPNKASSTFHMATESIPGPPWNQGRHHRIRNLCRQKTSHTKCYKKRIEEDRREIVRTRWQTAFAPLESLIGLSSNHSTSHPFTSSNRVHR